jgi:hypothetical protein
MERLSKQLKCFGFVQLHRSWLVRAEFIERLIHHDQRWEARLRDGTHVAVARSHIRDVLSLISGDSSVQAGSRDKKSSGQRLHRVSENLVKADG